MRRICLWALGLILCASPSWAVETYNFSTRNAALTVINTEGLPRSTVDDLICLSLNIYHESRGTSRSNQIAVALVTRNRHRLTGRSYCSVVYERNGTRGAAQFSWTVHRHTRRLEKPCWDQAQQLAWLVMMDNSVVDITRGATHFHERHIRPEWTRRAQNRVNIGSHTFVRLRSYEEVAQAR